MGHDADNAKRQLPANPTAALPTTPAKPKGATQATPQAKRMLRRLIQGEQPPTQPLALVERLAGSPFANPLVQVDKTDTDKRKVLQFALDLAESMFRYGAGSLEVETSIIAVTAAFDMRSVDIDITNQSVMINYAPKNQVPITLVRVVRSWTNNYRGLADIHALVTRITQGELDRTQAAIELREITTRSKPYSRWMITAAIGVFAAAIAALIGGDWLASLLAAAVCILVYTLQRRLSIWRIPEFINTALCAFTATAIAQVLWYFSVPVAPGLIVAGGILILLPAGRLVTATQDAINGFPVTAAGRYIAAFLVFGGLVSGISVAVVVGDLVGVPGLDIAATLTPQYPAWALTLFVGLAVLSVGIMEQSRPSLLIPTALVGMGGYVLVLIAGLLEFGDRLTPALAAIGIGFLARFVALKMRAPQLVVAITATLFLYPGLAIFRAMYAITIDYTAVEAGILGLFNALTIILAIAAGLVFGDTMARPLTVGLNSNERRQTQVKL